MTPREISKMIEKEIGGDWRRITNCHSCDLQKCLIRPKKRKVQFGEEIREVWIVLEENPEMLDGSKVFYDSETNKFGLALNSEPISYSCNFHDTFLAAFNSM